MEFSFRDKIGFSSDIAEQLFASAYSIDPTVSDDFVVQSCRAVSVYRATNTRTVFHYGVNDKFQFGYIAWFHEIVVAVRIQTVQIQQYKLS